MRAKSGHPRKWRFIRYSVAMLAVAAAFALRQIMARHLGGEIPTYLTFFPALMVAGIVGGLWAGILATVVAAGLATVLILPPHSEMAVPASGHLVGVGLFLAVGVCTSIIADSYSRARHRVATQARQRAIRQKKDALHRYEMLADRSRDIILFVRRDDGHILEVNSAAVAAYGYSRDEFLALSIHQLRAPGPRALTLAQMDEADIHGILFETAHQRKDGSIFPVEVSSQGATLNDARILISVVRDISERKRSEELLRESQERLRVTLTSIGDAVLTSDTNGQVTFINPVAATLTGWTAEEAIGQPIQSIFRIFNEQTTLPADDIVARVLREGRVVELANHTALRARDGREIPIEDSAAPILDSAGNVTGVVLVFHDVTEKRRAQKALRQSEERYRSLVHLSPDAIYVHRENRIDYVNPAAVTLFGATSAEQILGKSPYDLFHSDFHELIRKRIARLRQGEPAPLLEEQILRLDGRVVDVEVTASPFSDQEGSAIQVILHDITERRQKEEQSRKFNRTLRALSASNQALLRATTESALLNQICRIITQDCGHPMVWIGFAENDDSKSVRPVAHAGFEDGYLETLGVTWADNVRGRGPTGTAIRTGQPSACRNMLTDPRFAPWREEARRRGYASSLVVPLMSMGRAFGAISIYAREANAFSEDELKLLTELAADLSHGIEAMRLRDSHARAEESLRASNERLQLALEAAHAGTWEYDLRTGRDKWSDEVWDLYHLDPDEHEPSYELWLTRVHPDDLSTVVSTLGNVARHGIDLDLEYRVLDPDGNTRWLLARGRPEHDASGQPVRYVGIVMDITERKQTEQALLRSEKLASVGRMAATIAHEINNPLAAVMNTLYLARTVVTEPDTTLHYLDMADSELRRISHITRQALGFYRESTAPVLTSVTSVLESVLDLLRSKIAAKHVSIERDWEGDVTVMAVSGELRQVFSNLVANSLDALEENGTIRLKVSGTWTEGSRQRVRITVADNGKGVPAMALPHLFEPFFSTKDSGTGLGLWVTKQIVDKHGGSIRVRSRISGTRRGTAFSVVLPTEAASAAHAAGV